MCLVEKKITIITPCHNSEKFLADCWLSIKNQTIGIENLVCIFVDDASTDSTWDMILQIEAEAPDSVIALKLEENLRQGGARNAALAYVDTPYVQFLDSDDCLCTNACEILYDYAQKYNADLIQFGQQHSYDSVSIADAYIEESEPVCFNISNVESRKFFLNSNVISYCHSNKFYSAALLQKSGVVFAEKKIFEEPPFVYPQLFYAENILLAKEQLYIVRLHSESTMSKDKVNHFYDLPNVQYELFQFMLQKEDIYPIYRNEINSYFLWSFYILTIMSAYQVKGSLSIEYFNFMQKLCRMIDQDWITNPINYSYGKNAIDIISSMNYDIDSQDKLDAFLQSNIVESMYNEIAGKNRIVPNLLVTRSKGNVLVNETYEQTESSPFVSIILTTYNRASIVTKAINSILNQTYKNFELIIVDDCSSDLTEEVIAQINDSRIVYIKNKRNLGAGGSRNVGIKAAKYDLIAFEDDDDLWHADKLEKQIKLMLECDERVGMVYCEYEKRAYNLQESRVIPDKCIELEFKSGYIFPYMLRRNVIGADTVIIRKKALDKVGLFREDLICFEDWELFLRLSKEYYIILYPEVLLDVNVTSGSVSFKNPEIQLKIIREVQSAYNRDFERFNLVMS